MQERWHGASWSWLVVCGASPETAGRNEHQFVSEESQALDFRTYHVMLAQP